MAQMNCLERPAHLDIGQPVLEGVQVHISEEVDLLVVMEAVIGKFHLHRFIIPFSAFVVLSLSVITTAGLFSAAEDLVDPHTTSRRNRDRRRQVTLDESGLSSPAARWKE